MEQNKIGIRAVGVAVKDGNLLVQRDGNEYALPGGTVEFGESTEETLKREYLEELGADIRIHRLLWTEETFWSSGGCGHHGIAFYYLIEILDDRYVSQDGAFVPQKDNPNIFLGWMPMEDLRTVTIYPTFLDKELRCLQEFPKHFITRE